MKKKKKKKKLPIGLSDFKEVIEYDYYYFDKTKFIENILEDRSKVKLFTRPRRFGKTLNISMLKYFFDVKNKDENRKLFEGLNISKSEYFDKQGEFPVISISFKNYNKNDWESGFKSVKSIVSDIYAEFEYLMEHLNKRDLKRFEDIWLEKDEGDWEKSLLNLTRYLYNYYGKKVIILIDEYDQPIINSYIRGYYKEAIDFFKNFYGTVLKDNEYLEMSVMTGILRVAKENIFSGLNNIKIHSILNKRFTEYFGILENEVEDALKDFGMEYDLLDVQKWYNGYLFGDTKVYNPWSIINFLDEEELGAYWVNTSGNQLIQLYLQRLKNEIFEDFSKLLNEESIFKFINESMTFDNLEANFEKNIWNLFFHSGYLTLAENYNKMRNNVSLKIPNKEILEMFSEMFIEVYFKRPYAFFNMTNALEKGDMKNFKIELNKILLENVGIFDVSGTYKEQFYHGLMLGLVLKMRNEYEISSNGFAGKGRYDLLLKPKNIFDKFNKSDKKEGIIFEFKILNITEKLSEDKIKERLEKECEIALKQIDGKKYVSALRNAGIERVLKIGVAFYGKEVEVKFDRKA